MSLILVSYRVRQPGTCSITRYSLINSGVSCSIYSSQVYPLLAKSRQKVIQIP